MATYRTFGITADTQQTVNTIGEMSDLLPRSPELPSMHCLDMEGQSVQIAYGDLGASHHTVKHVTAYGVDKHTYATIEDARAAFLKLAQSALG